MNKEEIYKKFKIVITGEKIIPPLSINSLRVDDTDFIITNDFASKVSSITNIEKNEKIDLQGLYEHTGKTLEESMDKTLKEAKDWIESNIKLNPNLLYQGNKGWVQIISSDLEKHINQWINDGTLSKDILCAVEKVAVFRGDKKLMEKIKKDYKI